MSSIILKSVLAFIVILFFGIFYGLSKYEGHFDLWWAFIQGHDKSMCDLTLPPGYQVVSNGTQYAIKIKDEYLWLRIDDYSTLSWVEEDSRFEDSCKAKLLAFTYYEQELKKTQEKALVIPFVVVKPPKPTETLKAINYNTTIYISYPNRDTLKTLEEKQLLDSAVKDLQSRGGGNITVQRTRQGFHINSQAWTQKQ